MSTTKKRKPQNNKKSQTSKKRRARSRKQENPSLAFWLFSAMATIAIFILLMSAFSSPASKPVAVEKDTTKTEFIETLVPHAQDLQEQYGILPSIIIGQAILESDWGRSDLGKLYFNLFGVKAYGDAEQVKLTTKEFANNQWIEIVAAFRVYASWQESMNDHTLLFVNGVDWNPALYQDVLTATNYQEAARALQQAGYATDPDYAEKIISVIETYGLAQYDK